jgi:hypothetical protein
VSTLRKFECGTGTIPSCPLLQADEAKVARTKLDKTSTRPTGTDASGARLITPDSKSQRVGKTNDNAPAINDLMGTLIYTGADMMPSVNETNPALRLCAACQRVGRNCPWGAICKMIHDLSGPIPHSQNGLHSSTRRQLSIGTRKLSTPPIGFRLRCKTRRVLPPRSNHQQDN